MAAHTLQTKARPAVALIRRDPTHFIDGADNQSSTRKHRTIFLPLEYSLIGRVTEGGEADVDAAVQAATHDPAWGKHSVIRRTVLPAVEADQINNRLTDFLTAHFLDTGKPAEPNGRASAVRAASIRSSSIPNFPTYASNYDWSHQ